MGLAHVHLSVHPSPILFPFVMHLTAVPPFRLYLAPHLFTGGIDARIPVRAVHGPALGGAPALRPRDTDDYHDLTLVAAHDERRVVHDHQRHAYPAADRPQRHLQRSGRPDLARPAPRHRHPAG